MAFVKEPAFIKVPINLTSDIKFIRLIDDYHSDGFMVYWLLLLYLQAQEEPNLELKDLQLISQPILKTDFEKARAIIVYCLEKGLLDYIDKEKTVITSPMLMEQREKMEKVRAERSRAGKASAEKRAAEIGLKEFEFPLIDGTFYKLPATLLAKWESKYKNVTRILNYIQDYFKEPKNRTTKTVIENRLLEWIKSNQK